MKSDDSLKRIIQQWNTRALPPEIAALSDAARQRHDGVAAVLFYGSCLRSGRVDEGMADLYLLVDDYKVAFHSRLQAWTNRLLPPNVFYLELPHGERTLRAKYAVLTLDDFAKGTATWFHSYIWGRFAQPSALVYARDAEAFGQVQDSLARALYTFVGRALPQVPEIFTPRELWGIGLSLSYRCELRSEKPGTAVRLYDAAPDYYEAVTIEALKARGLVVEPVAGRAPGTYRTLISRREKYLNRLGWHLRKVQGKALSALRLLKAPLTFDNGLDYILWKIERHSGVRVEPGPSLRRFPASAVCVTFWKLFRKGGFR